MINIPVFEILPKTSLGCLTYKEPVMVKFKHTNYTSAETNMNIFAIIKALNWRWCFLEQIPERGLSYKKYEGAHLKLRKIP